EVGEHQLRVHRCPSAEAAGDGGGDGGVLRVPPGDLGDGEERRPCRVGGNEGGAEERLLGSDVVCVVGHVTAPRTRRWRGPRGGHRRPSAAVRGGRRTRRPCASSSATRTPSPAFGRWLRRRRGSGL